MKIKHIYKLLGMTTLLVCMFLLHVPYIEAGVTNTISVSSNTGGNTAKQGTVIEGETHTSAHIVTTINGEIVEEIHETSTSGPIHIERTHYSKNNTATSSFRIYAGGNAYKDDSYKQDSGTYEKVDKNKKYIISNTHKDGADKSIEQYTLFARLFFTFSKTISHVLSNLI